MLSISVGGADLTLGVAPNDGAVTPATAGGELGLANNNADSTLTVNAVLADNATPSALTKYGAGAVVLATTNTLSGPVTISQGTLNLPHSLTLQNASLASAGATFDASVAARAFTLGNLTNTFALPLLNTAAEPITLTVGNNGGSSLFGGVLSGAGGSLAKVGAGTLTLAGASTYNGGTDIRSGTLATGVAGGLGTGPVTNNATLNLTGGAVTYTALGTTLSGAGTVNVTLGTGSAHTALNGDYSAFTGTWNIGAGAATGAGKVQMNGADNADATVNVLENGTVFVSQPVPHQAAALLYGGTTGESLGQMRLDGSAVWAGPVTLAGDCLDPAKGFFGSNSGTGTISGVVSDLGGAHPVNKVGGGVFVLANTANTYAGPTWVRQGNLIAASITNVGVASSLGQPANAADGTIKLGTGTTAARLTYAGTGDTTDRVIDLAGTTGAGYLEQSGSGTLTLTSDLTYSGAGGKTLYLQGSTEGVGKLAGVYGDGLPYTNKLIKAGSGQWILSAANTYRGETEVQEGTLTVAHPNAIPSASLIRMTGTASRNAVLDLSNDGVGQTEKNITIGVGYRGTLAAGAGVDGVAVDHLFNEWSLSLTTVTVTRAASVLSGTPSITVKTANLSGGNSYRTTISPADVDIRIGRAAVLSNGNLTKTLHLDGTSVGNVITGTVYNGLSGSTVVLDKTGSGTWTLEGSNTYSGATTVNNGTLTLSGPHGAIANTSGFTVNAGGTLRLANAPAANNTNRMIDSKALTLNGGTLDFSHTAGTADYSETVGAVTASGAGSVISASQAATGQASALTLTSLTRTGNGTLDFSGTGLGASDRNRIFIGGQQDGLIGFWATYGGAGLAAYSAADGVYAGSTSTANLAARGPTSVIDDDPLLYARITEDGESGPVTLGGAPLSRAATVVQAAGTNCQISTTGKTLATHALAIEAGGAALTLGAAEGDGALTALAPGGKLDLINDSASPLTINAALSNNAAAVSIAKSGNGEVLLNGPCSYSGGTAINAGALVFASSATQALVGAISGPGSLVKAGTNLLTLAGRNTFTGVTYINEGIVLAQTNAAFGSSSSGTVIADGATLDVGANLAANNLNLGAEAFTVSGSGADGKGAIVNNSGTSQYAVFGRVTLAGDTTFGGAQSGSRFDIRNNTPTLTMNGFTLTKKGPNMFGLTSANVVPGAGHIDVQEGTLRFENNTRMNGDASNTLTLRSGTSLELYRHYPQNACAWTLVCKDDSLVNIVSANGSAQTNNWAGPIILDGTLRLTGAGTYHHVFGGPISGTGSLVKYGTTSTYMTNDYNTYSGYTWITNGTVYFSSVGMVGGAASSFGTPADAAAGQIRLGAGTSGVTLNYMGTGSTSDRVLELAGTTGGATFNQLGSGALRFTGGMAVTASGNKTLTLGGSTDGTGELAGAIPNPPTGRVAITKNGTGAWTLSGNNSFTGDVNITSGTLTLSGANAQGYGAILVASSAANAVLRLNSGCQLSSSGTRQRMGGIMVGTAGAAHGALYMEEGASVIRTPGTGDDQSFTMARSAGSYGYFKMSGGEFRTTRLQTGISSSTSTSNTVGNVRITGGALTLRDYMLLSRGKGCVSAFTVDGGTVYHTNTTERLSLGYEGGRAELNLTGGTVLSTTNLIVRQSTGSSTGIVNLCAGTLAVALFENNAGVALLNFAGGTLKTSPHANATVLPATLNGVYSYGAFGAFAGGATIDTAGRNCTVAAPLRAPGGNGVTGVTLSDKGSGYIGEPYVAINGDGVGATAVANMEDDGNGAYRVASVTVTCPGTGYTSATVLFNGGGRSVTAPTVGEVTLTPNTSGGLTKQGNGILTLNAANTYGGTTTVAGGTLKLGHAAALPTATQVTLAGGTLDLNGLSVTNAVNGVGTLANGAVRTVLSPAGEGTLGSDTVTLSSATLTGGTYLADVSPSGASDHVTVNGNIDLSGFDLVIVDPDQLNYRQSYTLLTCTGVRSGTFASAVLPNRWHVSYLANGTVKLNYSAGTLIRLR